MKTHTTRWRVSPVAWLPISLAIAAESVSNALRAYGLGMHLDRFTFNYRGYPVSVAGAVLVLAAIAVSLTQARAAWVTLKSGNPWRQRIVSGLAAVLLLTISIVAMASHILEAQRSKVADERGDRGRYDRALAAYNKADAELKALGNPRAVAVVQSEIQAVKIDMRMWRRSAQCSDITRDDTKQACEPVLALYKERGAAARKAELEPEVSRLRDELAQITRPEEMTVSEASVAGWWAWIMGLGVVFIATFGTVIWSNPVTVKTQEVPPTNGGQRTQQTIDELLLPYVGSGRSQKEIADELGIGTATVSRHLSKLEADGAIARQRAGKAKFLASA